MNNYLKPQSPIKDIDGDYIYPITTVDQVIMKDGGRLSKVIDGAMVPTPTSNDNGKFLKVVNGSPAWVNISNAEEMSF